MVIDARRTHYAIHLILNDGSNALAPFSTLSYEELKDEIATRIRISFPDVKLATGALIDRIGFGTALTLVAKWGELQEFEEVQRGVIEEISPNAGNGTFAVTAYDPVRATLASKIDGWYPAGQTPGTLIRNLMSQWTIPLGAMDPMLDGVTLGVQALRAQTISDCIQKWLQEGFENGMPRIVGRSVNGSLEFIQPGQNPVVYWFKSQESVLMPPKETLSIVDLVTRVEVRGNATDDGNAPLLGVLEGATQYGTRQEIVYLTDKKTPAEIESAGRRVLDEKGTPRHDRQVETLDVPGVRRYDRIRLDAGTRSGYQIIESVTHNVDQGTMSMTLGNVTREHVQGVFTLEEASIVEDPQKTAWGEVSWKRAITDEERYALALRVGWVGEEAVVAVAISIAEDTSGNAEALSSTNDIGLWQINEIWWALFGGSAALTNPLTNAQAAHYVFTKQGFQAWSTYNNKAYLQYLARARAASAHPSEPAATPIIPTEKQFNLATPPVLQHYNWSCSAASLAWALSAAGHPTTEQQAVDLLGPSRINPSKGLLDGSGQGLAAVARDQGFTSKAAPAGFDQVLGVAGTKPIMIGSTAWYHWTGVSGRSDNGRGESLLLLANPAPNYGGTTMDRKGFASLSPFYMVTIDP